MIRLQVLCVTKYCVRSHISTPVMPKPDPEQCAFVFNKLDTDHSGKLDIDELWEGMKKISNPNISREEVQNLQ